MDVIFHPDIEPALKEFESVNKLRPLLVYGVRAVQEYPGTLLPDERLFLVYTKPSDSCIHIRDHYYPPEIKDTCGFDRMFDIEKVAESLLERTSLSYDVLRADQWAKVYYYDHLLDGMKARSRARGGKYEMYAPRSLGESYLAAFDHWQETLYKQFDADLFMDATRMLLTSGKSVENLKTNSGVPQLVPLHELVHDNGKEFEEILSTVRDEWAQGMNIPEVWEDLPDAIRSAMRNKRNEQIMILNSVKKNMPVTDLYPPERISKLYAEFIFALHDEEKKREEEKAAMLAQA